MFMVKIDDASIVRFLGWVGAGMLSIAIFSVITPGMLLLLKIDAFALGLIFAFIQYKRRQHFYAVAFLLIALIFNPFAPLHLDRKIWQLIDLTSAVLFAVFAWQYLENYEKGKHFQDFIESLFPREIWHIADKTKDFSQKLGRLVVSDMHPDFTFQNIATRKKLAIECKYRSKFFDKHGERGFTWNYAQGARYKEYGYRQNIPVYIAFGLGGKSKKPERLFICPLEIVNSCQNGFISESFLKIYERPKSPFLNEVS